MYRLKESDLQGILRKLKTKRSLLVGPLQAILDGKPYAEKGEMHVVKRSLSCALVDYYPQMDGELFAADFLYVVWDYLKLDREKQTKHWVDLIESAKRKLVEKKEEVAEKIIGKSQDLNAAEITDAEERIQSLIFPHSRLH
jgi:hypothetical protein